MANSFLSKLEPVGAVNKGMAFVQIPAELPLPDPIRRHEFKVKEVLWGNVVKLTQDDLKTVIDKMGNTLPDYLEWKKKIDSSNGGYEWHYIIFNGKKVSRRAGFRKWMIILLVPPPWQFDSSDYRIAYLKKSPSTFMIPCGIIPHPIVTSYETWEEYQKKRLEENPGPWDEETTKKYKSNWKTERASKPQRWYGVLVPGYLTPQDLKVVDAMRVGIASSVLSAERNANAAAAAPALESSVKAEQIQNAKLRDQVDDLTNQLGAKTIEVSNLAAEREALTHPPLVMAEPKPPAVVVSQMITDAPAKKKPEPGSYKSLLWLLLIILGIGLLAYGQVVGVLPVIGAVAMYYLDYVRETNKKDAQKTKGVAGQSKGGAVQDVADKAKTAVT